MHADAASGERQRDPAGADAELERGAVADALDEEVDDLLRVQARGALVVARGDLGPEVIGLTRTRAP
ncbi:MAG TPA: hypothetical protein VFA30_08585 [Gaiellaceae bacterium]|nr:hypothetical protein [Gaiellaceae bacterium]